MYSGYLKIKSILQYFLYSTMKITVKQIKGCECCLEVAPSTTILEIKREIEKKCNIATETQKILHLGKTLADDNPVSSYPAIKDGTKLNLVVKKPDGLYDVSVKEFKKNGMSEKEAVQASSRLLTVVQQKLEQLSWDDINRLSMDFMLVKNGKLTNGVKPDNTEDNCGL